MNKVREFLESMKTNPQLQEMLRDCKTPSNDQEVLEAYYNLAKKQNIDISKKEFARELREIALENAEKSDRVAKQIPLSDEALDGVAGGGQYLSCDDTYQDGEWCWFTDSCDIIINDYRIKYAYDPNARDSVLDAPKDGQGCENMAQWDDIPDIDDD